MPKAKCPSCATVVTYAAGYDPICPSCGFRGSAPVPPRPMAWSAVPEAPGAGAPVAAVPAAVPGYVPVYAVARPQNGMASAALALGILGLVFFWFPVLGIIMAALGAILGGAGLAAAERDPQLAGSRGSAIAGLVLGGVGLVFALLVWGDAGWDEGPFWWDW